MQTINSVSIKECTGCGTCINICPAEAISMQENNEGFLYPVIDDVLSFPKERIQTRKLLNAMLLWQKMKFVQ